MADIAKYIRIFNPQPDDDFVTKRTEAIKGIEEAFKEKKSVADILKLGNDLSQGLKMPSNLDASLVVIVEKSIKAQSASFIAQNEELQIATCALVAALQYLEGVKPSGKMKLTVADCLAISLWSSCSFLPRIADKQKLESLRSEIIEISQNLIKNSAHIYRNRLEIPELKQLAVPEDNNLTTFASNVKKALSGIIEPLKTNAVLDREEINLLWWAINDWSEIVEERISKMNNVQKAIINGFEIATFLRRLPTEAHYKITMRDINDKKLYSGTNIIEQLGESGVKIKAYLDEYVEVKTNKNVFPLSAILCGETLEPDDLNIERTLDEWCGRALLEGTMLNMSEFLNDGN